MVLHWSCDVHYQHYGNKGLEIQLEEEVKSLKIPSASNLSWVIRATAEFLSKRVYGPKIILIISLKLL